MKSRLVILDANVIIEAFKNNFWKSLISQYEVYVGSTVIYVEVGHFLGENNQKHDIQLLPYVEGKEIKEIEATTDDIENLDKKINPFQNDLIHDGEKEIIALLSKGDFEEYQFYTGDAKAIKVMSALGIGSNGVSLEELLDKIGQKGKLPDKSYSREKLEKCKKDGLLEKDLIIRK